MSQVTNTSIPASTPWNRTPGKPGVGTSTSNISSLIPSCAAAQYLSATKPNINDNLDNIEDEKTTLNTAQQNLISSYIPNQNPDISPMWPLPLFDSTQQQDINNTNTSTTVCNNNTNNNYQWSNPQFTSTNVPGVGAMLGCGNTFTSTNSSSWSTFIGGGGSIPRAITGQQQELTTKLTDSISVPGGNELLNRRNCTNWNLSPDLDIDDRTGLVNHLSNMNFGQTIAKTNYGYTTTTGTDYPESQSNLRTMNKSTDFELTTATGVVLKHSGSSTDCDDAIRLAVNTTNPWGLHPVDQSIPWTIPDNNNNTNDVAASGCSGTTTTTTASQPGSPPLSDRILGCRTDSQQQQQVVHPRRLSSIASVSMGRDLESNIWPNEPPNGTGIWESHYESLGERTARWQQVGTNPQTTATFHAQSMTATPNQLLNQTNHPNVRPRSSNNNNSQQQQSDTIQNHFRALNRATNPVGLFSPLNQPPPVQAATAAVAPTNSTGPIRPLLLGSGPPLHHHHQSQQQSAIGCGMNTNLMTSTSTRSAFPLTNNNNTGGACANSNNNNNIGPSNNPNWPFPAGSNLNESGPAPTGINKNRWPNSNSGRQVGKQHSNNPIPPNHQNQNNMRWPIHPPSTNPPQMPGLWPFPEHRRMGPLPSAGGGMWPTSFPSTNDNPSVAAAAAAANLYNQSPPQPPSLSMPLTRPGQLAPTDFPSQLMPNRMNQMFKSIQQPPQPVTLGYNASNRIYLTPQQHLQQQSMLRAHVMRQLSGLGFADDEIHNVFADTNVNVERALVELHDRSGHPDLIDLINSVKQFTGNTNNSISPSQQQQLLMSMQTGDDVHNTDCLRQEPGRSMTMRTGFNPGDTAQNVKPNLPFTENLEMSLHLLQQRETQVLQTIMQLHSKHQELCQKVNQIRATNNSNNNNNNNLSLTDLQMQTFQIVQQLDAQQNSLKSIRYHASLLKQLVTTTNPSNTESNQNNSTNNSNQNNNNNNNSSTANWLSATSGSSNKPIDGSDISNNNNNNNQSDRGGHNNTGSLLWESGPWSGCVMQTATINQPQQQQQSTLDKRWNGSNSNNNNNRLPIFNSQLLPSLSDPRWSDAAAVVAGTTTSSNLCDPNRSVNELCATNLPTDCQQISSSIASKTWVLTHSIPHHVSVGMLKATISSALTYSGHTKSDDADATVDNNEGDGDSAGQRKYSDTSVQFDIHPNMSARWVLFGLSSLSEANIVQDCLENPKNGQVNGYYGLVNLITPNEALHRLLDIQALASRLKGLNVDSLGTATATSIHPNLQSGNSVTPDYAIDKTDVTATSHFLDLNTNNSDQ